MIDERIALDLDNMKQAAAEAISFVSGITKEDFLSDKVRQMACAMCLIIIGEATNRIERRSPRVCRRAPWLAMEGNPRTPQPDCP